jgi:hypothetical protein
MVVASRLHADDMAVPAADAERNGDRRGGDQSGPRTEKTPLARRSPVTEPLRRDAERKPTSDARPTAAVQAPVEVDQAGDVDKPDEAVDLDGLSSARDPGFHPRGQLERARRRSVRRGGTVVVGPGRRSVSIDLPVSAEIAGIVANVEPEVQDVRVEAVTVNNDSTARVTLNRPAPTAIQVAWYVVSNPFRESA